MSREEIVLTTNQEYYEGPSKIDKVIYKLIPDVDTLMMALQKGEVDMGNPPLEKAVFDRLKAAGLKLKVINRGTWFSLVLNAKFKPFSDLRVRQAIAHAIDRDAIIEHVLSGMAEKLNSPVPKGFFGHTEEGLPRYDFDPEKARKLLADAGYGGGFEFNLDTPGLPNYLPLATALLDPLRRVGIKVNLVVTDNPSWMKKLTGGVAEATLLLLARPPDADIPLTQYFHSASFSPGYNLMRYTRVDAEIDKARNEPDETRRKKMYQEIQKKVMEDLPNIPLLMWYNPTAYQPNITGLPDRDPVWGVYFYPLGFAEGK